MKKINMRQYFDYESCAYSYLLFDPSNNKSPGETALYWEEKKILFLGDALIGNPPGEVSLLPPEKYADIEKSRAGIKVLDPLNFNSVLMGDGEPILTGGKKAIVRFLDQN